MHQTFPFYSETRDEGVVVPGLGYLKVKLMILSYFVSSKADKVETVPQTTMVFYKFRNSLCKWSHPVGFVVKKEGVKTITSLCCKF